MRKRILSMLLVLVMVLGMIPAPVSAAEYTAITTNAGAVISVQSLGTVTTDYGYQVNHTHITVPAGATTVTVAYPYALAEYTMAATMNGGTVNQLWSSTATPSGSNLTIPIRDYIAVVSGGKWVSGTGVISQVGWDPVDLFTFEYEAAEEPEDVPVDGITLDQTALTLTVGGTATLAATVSPDNATDKTVTWTSSAPDIASVDGGVVTAKAAGTATITAKAGDKEATCTVTVNAPVAVTGITLDKTSVTLNANTSETVTLVPTITPDNATDKTIIWRTTDASVASVENGVVTARESGTVTITALCGTETATCEVTVERPVYSLHFYDDLDGIYTVATDEEVDAVASCTPKNTTDKVVTFESADISIVEVSPAEVTLNNNGQARFKLRGMAAGQTTVTVASRNRPDVTDTVTVKVVSCLHRETETVYEWIAETETHTATVKCKKCSERIGEVTTENCADADHNGQCDKCAGAVCGHAQTTTTYAQVEGQEKHTVTVTCNDCKQTVGDVTTVDCVDEGRDGKCDLCEGAVAIPCPHENKTTKKEQIAGQEKHTVTVTCDDCGKPVGDVTAEDCVDEAKDGTCDVCGGTVAIPAAEPEQVDGVYQLGSAADLLWFAAKVKGGEKSLSAKLTANIEIPSGQWTPIENFAGTFDGDGHTVTLNGASNGLFKSVIGTSSKYAEVKSVTVAGSISGTTQIAGIAGQAYYAKFTSCFNRATVTGSSNYVAGIVGNAANSTSATKVGHVNITACGNSGSITGSGTVAGIVGRAVYNVTVESCYNSGQITATAVASNAGGIGGYIQGYSCTNTITNCYNTGAVSGSQLVGGIIGDMRNGVTATNCYNTGVISGTSGKIGAIAGQAYHASTSKAVNCYYLDTSCGVAATNKPAAVNSGTTVKTETEMKSAELAAALGENYQANPNGYPVLYWQKVSSGAKTYQVTEPTTEGITFGGNETAFSTQAYEFTVTINDYYRATENFAVKVNDKVLDYKSKDGKVYTYEIEKPASDLVITVEGVESTGTVIWSGKKPGSSYYVSAIKIYDVTVTNVTEDGDDINIVLAEGTDLAMPIRFTLSHNGNWSAGGQSGCHLSFTPGADFVKNLSGGRMQQTIKVTNSSSVAVWNINISVEGLAEAEYVDVVKPDSNMYTVSGLDTAIKGGSYSFTVKLNSRYRKTDDFVVKANDQKLEEVNGEYTVPNVTDDIKITVEGVEMRTFSTISAEAALKGLYTVGQSPWNGEPTPYGNVPFYHVTVPYGTDSVNITYPSYWTPKDSGTQGQVAGWAYHPVTLENGVPVRSQYVMSNHPYTTNADGSHTVTVSVKDYLLKDSKGFSLLDNSLGFVGVLTFIVEDCSHPAANIKTTYAAAENNTHTVTRTCLVCNGQVGEITTENCVDENPADGTCDLCKGDSTIEATAIALNKESRKLEIGKTFQLEANLTPANATEQVSWTSSDENIAKVDENGLVTAVAKGEAIITATAGEVMATCTITVTDVAKRVNVYLSLSSNADYMVAGGKVQVLQKIQVPWFDLTPYGLQEYTHQEGEVTVLHLYIYATEVLKQGVSAEDAGQGYLAESGQMSNLLQAEGAPGSIYLKKFWGYNENLRYFYNYVYPEVDGWGITADRLVLKDGDIITLGHHTNMEAHVDANNGFHYFAKGSEKLLTTTAVQGGKLELKLMRSSGGLGGVNKHTTVANTKVYCVSASTVSSGTVTSWTEFGTTDSDGILKANVTLTPGTYYLAVPGMKGIEHPSDIVSSPGAVILTVLEGEASQLVQQVIDMIDAIDEVTLAKETQIIEALTAYNNLSEEQQDAVTNADDLMAAVKKLEDLNAADAFEKLVEAIGEVALTEDCKAKIQAAETEYNKLTGDQMVMKQVIAAKKKLDEAKQAYDHLAATQEEIEAAELVKAAIDAIGEVTLEKENTITAVRAAYEELTKKELVTNLQTLVDAENTLAVLKVGKLVDEIGEVTADSEEKITAARAAFDALTAEQKALALAKEVEAALVAAEEALVLIELAGADIAGMYSATGSYLAGLGTPGVGSTNGEWRVIGLARAGKTVADGYYNKVLKFVQDNMDENSRLDAAKATENARLIIALTAIGKDVTDVGGHNLLTGLNEMSYVRNQGLNGIIWTLIAFNTHNYEYPAGDVSRDALISAIVGRQNADGGWSLGGTSDPDITGMALQALAPYKSMGNVSAAVAKAVRWLSEIQAKDGTFSYEGKPTSESLAQVITGLTALGIDPETDSRFVKGGVSAMDALSKFYLGNGTFEHGLGGGYNTMATEQAYYALVSYYRLRGGKTALYDMSDVTIERPVYEITEGANSQWQTDGKNLTLRANGAFDKFTGVKVDGKALDSKHYTAKAGSTIVTIAAEYLKTLSEDDHTITLVFTDGEASTMITVLPSDAEAAKRVDDLIDAIGPVTENSGKDIKAAEEAYKKLTDAQKKLVTKYQTLLNSRSEYNKLASMISVTFTLLGCYKHDSDKKHTLAGGNLDAWIPKQTYKVEAGSKVKDVLETALAEAGMRCSNPTGNYVESINGIGEFTNGSFSGWMYTLNGVHPNLGVAQQSVDDGDVIIFHYTDDYTMESGGLGFGEDKAIKRVEALIDAIGTVTLDKAEEIEAARKAFDNLTYDQKQKVKNYEKLTDAEIKYDKLKKDADEKAAEEVEDMIDKLDSKSETFEEDVKAAKKAYDNLTADQKKLVGNYFKLTNALKELASQEDKKAAEEVELLIAAIGTVTRDSGEKIKTARDAYNALTAEQKALVENLFVLEAAEEKLAKLEELKEVLDIHEVTGDFMEDLGTPVPGTVGGEWMVVGLVRADRELKELDAYYEAAEKFVQENADENSRLHKAKSTENSRMILALTAMGKDVTNVGGHNLLDGLNSMEYVQKQGINGPIWALIAFDSGNYATPAGDVSRENLLDVILNARLEDGGWALSGELSDADMTGMALQALAPYYETNEDVAAAVDAAIEALSLMQAADGSFSGIDGKSSESIAQVIVALSALGIDADTDPRFIKNGISALDALHAFYVEGGGFRHIPDGELDGMATEQAYYALTAYFRMVEGKTALYDMTDVVDMGGDKEIALPAETEPAPTEAAEEPVQKVQEEKELTFWQKAKAWFKKLF